MTDAYQKQLIETVAPGSMKEVWVISFPLILSALSMSLMAFLDRLILAKYSIEAMNAAAASSMACLTVSIGFIAITGIAEVFVGQYNGQGQKEKLGEPVWQMIWFSLFSLMFSLPLTIWGGVFMVPEAFHSEGLPYYRWLMGFNPIFAMVPAVASFFVGQGQVKVVLGSVIMGNITNVLLDYLLIFGYGNLIPSWGAQGAAVATVFSQFVQVGILLRVFFKQDNRKHYGTTKFAIKKDLMWSCLKIGTPASIGHMMEIAAWALLMHLLTSVSTMHMAVLVIGQTFHALFSFMTEGLQKGVSTIAANYIGARRLDIVHATLISAMKLLGLIILLLAIPFLLYPEPMILHFIAAQDTVAFQDKSLFLAALNTLKWILVYFTFDGLVWIIAGIFVAAGKTVFVMLANMLNAWLFAIVPIYWFIVIKGGGPELTWSLICAYGFANAMIFYIKFRMKTWEKSARLIPTASA